MKDMGLLLCFKSGSKLRAERREQGAGGEVPISGN